MVRGRFCVKRCGPSRHRLRDASAVLENFARHPKKTFSTLSAQSRRAARLDECPLLGDSVAKAERLSGVVPNSTLQ